MGLKLDKRIYRIVERIQERVFKVAEFGVEGEH
jgi:hypothetical protein